MANNASPDLTSYQHMYFEMLAEIGVTKHVGALAASDEMLALCRIDAQTYVLDVGCGSRTMVTIFRDASTRTVLKEATQEVPGIIAKLLGYGVCAGRKASS